MCRSEVQFDYLYFSPRTHPAPKRHRASNEFRSRYLVITNDVLCQLSYGGRVRGKRFAIHYLKGQWGARASLATRSGPPSKTKNSKSSPSWARTSNLQVNSLARYQLRHRGLQLRVRTHDFVLKWVGTLLSAALLWGEKKKGNSAWGTRTPDHVVKSHALYQLS